MTAHEQQDERVVLRPSVVLDGRDKLIDLLRHVASRAGGARYSLRM